MNTLKSLILVLFISCTFINFSQGQKFSEVGLGLGTYLYHGDLTKKLFVMEGFQFSGHLFYRYNFNQAIAAKAQVGYGTISAYDYATGFTLRNLHFKSHIAEFTITGQVDILALIRKDRPLGKLSPFLFVGGGVFNFSPKAEFNDEWHKLQPLGTEGQGMSEFPDREKYKLTQFSIPFGLDLRYNIGRKLFMGFEMGFRKTFTDYLDDVSTTYVDNGLLAAANGELAAELADRSSDIMGEGFLFNVGKQRGDSEDMDWFFLFDFYVTYNFINKRQWKNTKQEMF